MDPPLLRSFSRGGEVPRPGCAPDTYIRDLGQNPKWKPPAQEATALQGVGTSPRASESSARSPSPPNRPGSSVRFPFHPARGSQVSHRAEQGGKRDLGSHTVILQWSATAQAARLQVLHEATQAEHAVYFVQASGSARCFTR